jgi:chromosome segregation ATPase
MTAPDPKEPTMQPDSGPRDLTQALQVVAWLEEERRRDKADLQRVQTALDQMAGRFREILGRLEVAEGELRATKSQIGSSARTDDAIRLLRETTASLQQWREEHERAGTRAGQTQAVEAERDRRVVADLQGKSVEVAREIEALKGRFILLGEEMRRDKGNVPALQQELDLVAKKAQTLADQLGMVEDGMRHRDARLGELSRQSERLVAEQSRFTDWQRLSEVRWTRQLAEWQQQMEEWRHQADAVGIQMEANAQLMPVLKDELAELRRLAGEQRELLTGQSNKTADLEAQQSVAREAASELSAEVVKQNGRADELTGYYHNLMDRMDRLNEQLQATDSRLRAERERIETILLVIARLESQDETAARRSEELAMDLAGAKRTHDVRAEQIEQSLGEQGRRLSARVQELERLDAEHKQREIVELEQQIREMQERARQSKS